jgi:hypothetical protein
MHGSGEIRSKAVATVSSITGEKMLLALTRLLAIAGLAALLPQPSPAQETAGLAGNSGLALSLNAADTEEGGCVLSFLVRNSLGGDIEKVVYETVLFTTEGRVERLMLLDMGTLPEGRPRVARFKVAGMACEALGSLLINGAETCEAGDLGAGVCIDALSLSSDARIGIDG